MIRQVVLGAALAALRIETVPAFGATPAGAPSDRPTTVCASHLLIRFWGAVYAQDLRTSPVARLIALEALDKVRRPGADFETVARELAKAHPDMQYERTGPFSRGKFPAPFEDVVFSLREGQVADEITTTVFGFHIIRRNPAVRCRHILIAYQGAARAVAARSKDEARKSAEQVREEAMKPGADFVALVRRHSDSPDKARGGDVGIFDRGTMIQSFENAAFARKPGEISPVTETRFGFHIIQRIE